MLLRVKTKHRLGLSRETSRNRDFTRQNQVFESIRPDAGEESAQFHVQFESVPAREGALGDAVDHDEHLAAAAGLDTNLAVLIAPAFHAMTAVKHQFNRCVPGGFASVEDSDDEPFASDIGVSPDLLESPHAHGIAPTIKGASPMPARLESRRLWHHLAHEPLSVTTDDVCVRCCSGPGLRRSG